jgi:hypothetical protein
MPRLTSIDFSEIRDGYMFEDLVADYFRARGATVPPPSVGADGGRDILATFPFYDSLVEFERRWVVQCKFHEGIITKKHLSSVNIPTLVHVSRADGYLLVCKREVGPSLTAMFETQFNY